MQPLPLVLVYTIRTVQKTLETAQYNIHGDLIERCKTNDRLAQYELYKLYKTAMFNVCLRFMKNREEAEDVLQESFVNAFSKMHSYRADASFGAWLKRIVVNNAINQLRKRKLELAELDENHNHIVDDSGDTHVEIDLNVQRIKESIQLLPDGFRTVLSLYLLEGYDHLEISEVLGITESTSKSQYMRAKRKLKSMLEIEES